MPLIPLFFTLFFFNDTATTEIYTLSLHDALPISSPSRSRPAASRRPAPGCRTGCSSRRRCRGRPDRDASHSPFDNQRSEEHTSELQSPDHLACRLLLPKKNALRLAPVTEPTVSHT